MPIFHQLAYGVKRALGRDVAGHDFTVFPDDIYLVSYPKSGNTWTRFLVANLAHPEDRADFANINRLTPDPEALSRRYLKSLPRPRIIKSHLAFRPAYRKVIYIVRDPRDVVLSQYYFNIKRRTIEEGFSIERFVTEFIAGQRSEPDYGSWGENAASWLAARGYSAFFLLIRYEDLLTQATTELAKIAGFLGIEADATRLAEVVKLSSAEQMRGLERKQAHLWSSTKDTRLDKPFVRSAQSGGWRKDLPEKSVDQIERAWGPLMGTLGYPLTVKDYAPLKTPFFQAMGRNCEFKNGK
jgi:hypothetical protein